jgi:endogenous inhibitor of DNA gyrase (YacG/DUF329 family)
LIVEPKPLRCPTCKQPLPVQTSESKTFPFCSERCRLVDLGNWLDGRYALTEEEPPKN